MNEHSGDADAAIDALPRVAAAAGVRGYAPCPIEVVEREMAVARRTGAFPMFYGEDGYPAALAELSDAPPLLWARGDRSLTGRQAIAIVGARNASSLGRRMAKALSSELGKANLVVVSGLARGIDAVVHDSALDTGTIAVVAGGVDIVYPRENSDLTARIAAEGLILSEMPMGMQPQARHFPRRNRIISGLSRAVVVVEAAARSGSLITARDALDQGREVLCVPGHPLDARASGCNMLIRDGATLVRSAEDILEAIGPIARDRAVPGDRPVRSPPRRTTSARKAAPPVKQVAPGTHVRDRILSLLGTAPIAEDQLLRDLSLPSQQVASELLDLELEGAVQRQPGGLLALTA